MSMKEEYTAIDMSTAAADGFRDGQRAANGHSAQSIGMVGALATALDGLLSITEESEGVAGYHLNGEIAEWGEFPEVITARDVISAYRATDKESLTAADSQASALTEAAPGCFVQPVPSHCDRITWRGHYYQLPDGLTQASAAQNQCGECGFPNGAGPHCGCHGAAQSAPDVEIDAIQLAFELGGLEDGSYHLEVDELEQVIKRAVEPYADALRALASYVGAGGYNAPTVDPAEFEAKVRWGIDNLMPAQSAPAGEREAFEAAYAEQYNKARGTTCTAEDIASLREGPIYADRYYLNGQWKGWQARAAWQRTQSAGVPEGWRLVPVEPTEEMWSGLARHLMMWLDFGNPTVEALRKHLDMLSIEWPAWMDAESELRGSGVPSKGTRATLIYKAMLADCKGPGHG